MQQFLRPSAKKIRKTVAQQVETHRPAMKLSRNAQACIDSLATFVRESWHVLEPSTPLIWNWHLQAMCDHVQALLLGTLGKNNLLINVPPGSAKSRIVSVAAIAWMWLRNPSRRYISSSGNARVSTRDSVYTRQLIESAWYRDTFGVRWTLAADQDTKLLFATSVGGFRQALTVGQKVTGDRADGLFIDDPLDATDSNSVVSRRGVLDWYDMALANRLNDLRTGTRCVIAQRLHQEDLPGHLLARDPENWELLCIPQLWEESQRRVTSLGWTDPRTAEGELMFPTRFPDDVIAQERKRLGSAGFAGQHQQRPASAEGEIFKRGHFGFYDPTLVNPAVFTTRCQAWDTAYSLKTTADFSVGFEFGMLPTGVIYVLNRARGRFAYPELRATIIQWGTLCRPNAVAIENAASGQSVIQDLQATTGLPIVPVKPDGDKIARANSIVPTYEAGTIYLPQGAPWVEEFLDELHTFPMGSHDDQVDAFVHGIRWLTRPKSQVFWASLPRSDRPVSDRIHRGF